MAYTLKFLQINVNHDIRAQDACLAFATREKVDIILISEPYTRNLNPSINAPGWRAFVKNRNAILVTNSRPLSTAEVQCANEDLLVLEVNGITITHVYCPPHGDLPAALSEAENILLVHPHSLVAGDFNCSTSYIPGNVTNLRGHALEDFITNNGLLLWNTIGATWERSLQGRHITSTPDYTISTVSLEVSAWSIRDDDSLSDHRYITFNTNLEKEVQPVVRYKVDNEILAREIAGLHLQAIPVDSTPAEIDAYVETLTRLLQVAVKTATSQTRSSSIIQWWNPSLELLKAAVKKASRLLRNTNDPLTYRILQATRKTLRSTYKKLISTSKETAWREFCSSTKLWGKPYAALKKRKMSQVGSSNLALPLHLRNPGTGLLLNESDSAQLLLQLKFPDDPNPDELNHLLASGASGPPNWVSAVEIGSIIKSLNNKKAPGPDSLSNKTLKSLHRAFPEVLESLFNACICQAYFPSKWKKGSVVMIPKHGKDPESVDGYRPITLLSNLGKSLERIIKTELEDFIESRLLINQRQFGFRRGRSTEMALNAALDQIHVLRGQYELVAAISLDIKGAFDHARWPDILRQCATRGVPHYILALLRSYFTDRTVTYAGSEVALHRGCPQGSVLGPLLWLIAFDGVMEVLQSEERLYTSSTQCFADDTLLIVVGRTPMDLNLQSSLATSAIEEFLGGRGLVLNTSKTELIIFDKRKAADRRCDPCPCLDIGETTVARRPSLTYLGVILDDGLTFEPHIRYIVQKGHRYLPIFLAICRNLYGYSTWARRIMVEGTIGSLLNYCSSVFWRKLQKQKIKNIIRPLQRQAAINAGKLYRSTSCDAALVIARIVPLDLAAAKRAWRWQILQKRRNSTSELSPFCRFAVGEIDAAISRQTTEIWQEQWSKSKTAGWTHELIPDIRVWLDLQFNVDFWSGQALSGHGCFAAYLHLRKRRASAACACGHPKEDAAHVMKDCHLHNDIRPPPPLKTTPDHISFMVRVVRRLWEAEQRVQRNRTLLS